MLFELINNFKAEFDEYKTLCETLERELHKRFDYTSTDPIILIAAFVDPATTAQLKSDECARAKELLIPMVNCFFFILKNFI